MKRTHSSFAGLAALADVPALALAQASPCPRLSEGSRSKQPLRFRDPWEPNTAGLA